MRDYLRALEGQRIMITGTVAKFGCRPLGFNLYGDTVLLEGVTRADGAPLTDHTWLPLGARIAALDPHKGDVLSLLVRVMPYTKHQFVTRKDGRYQHTYATLDYKLAYPSRIRKVTSSQEGVSA